MRNLKTILSRSCRLLMLAGSVMTAPVSSFGQNHNPDFGVSSTFLGGEPYTLVGEDDNEVYPNRTPVELKYREEAPEGGRTGMTTLEWSSGGDKVDSYDSSSDEDGVVDGTASASPAGPWTWTDDAEQQDYDGKTIHLQGKAAAASGDTATLKASHDEDTGNPFEKTFTLLKVDLEVEPDPPILSNYPSYESIVIEDGVRSDWEALITTLVDASTYDSLKGHLDFQAISAVPNTDDKGQFPFEADEIQDGEPVRYWAKTEDSQMRCEAENGQAINPVTQKVTIGLFWNGTQVAETDVITRSRFNFLRLKNEHDKAIQSMFAKYSIHSRYANYTSASYDPSLPAGTGGATNSVTLSVTIGSSALINERWLASVLYHEGTHVGQGPALLVQAAAGSAAYTAWEALADPSSNFPIGTNTIIATFAYSELEAYLDQLLTADEFCLSDQEIVIIQDEISFYEAIIDKAEGN